MQPRLILAASLTMLAVFAIVAAQTDAPPAVTEQQDDGTFGVFHPDRPAPPKPDPDTIYARRIVLSGPDVVITLDADPEQGQPGILVTSRKSGQTAAVYISKEGRAVVGIRDRKAPNLPAALFSADGNGFLQLREGPGAHVLRPSEIDNRRQP
jgi:hypothetical protein